MYEQMEASVLMNTYNRVRGNQEAYSEINRIMTASNNEIAAEHYFKGAMWKNKDSVLTAFTRDLRNEALQKFGLATITSDVQVLQADGPRSEEALALALPDAADATLLNSNNFLFLTKFDGLRDIFPPESVLAQLPTPAPNEILDGLDFKGPPFYARKDINEYQYNALMCETDQVIAGMKNANINNEIELAKISFFTRTNFITYPYGTLQELLVDGERERGELADIERASYNKLGTKFFEELQRPMEDSRPSAAAEQ